MGGGGSKFERAFLVNGKQHRILFETHDYSNSGVYIDGKRLDKYLHDPFNENQKKNGVPFQIDKVNFKITTQFNSITGSLTKITMYQEDKALFSWRTDGNYLPIENLFNQQTIKSCNQKVFLLTVDNLCTYYLSRRCENTL